MSYDLVVFDPAEAPNEQGAFVDWFRVQTEWSESHDYNDPTVSTNALQVWFYDFIKEYPPLNGPLASEDFDNSKVTDYSIHKALIYACFAWSEAQDAYHKFVELVKEYHLGFFDVSGEEGLILRPDTKDVFRVFYTFYATNETIMSDAPRYISLAKIRKDLLGRLRT